jgi:methionyl-tRNA formyltransferase
MQPRSKTILFFGNERLASGLGTSAPALRGLIDAGYHVAAVVVAQNKTHKSRKQRPLEVAEIAAEHSIAVIAPTRLHDAVDELSSYHADVAVLAAYGKIVPQVVLDIFPNGIINIHPSLLPLHRGSTPIESALLHGDRQTGVSLMRLAPEMDAGPVYSQKTVVLTGQETKQALAEQLNQLGADLLLAHLPAILNGSLEPINQESSLATIDAQLSKSDAQLDWQKPADELERQVRAYATWPRSRCMIGTNEIIVTRTHVTPGIGVPGTLWLGDDQLGMHTSEGILIIDTLIPPGKKEMTGSAFLLGYKTI